MKASVRKAPTPPGRTAIRNIERRLVTQHPRRRVLSLAAGAAALPAVSRISWAQAYPSRLVRIIVGAAPGGSQDIAARLIGQWLSERLGRQFIVENRTGGGINGATEAVVKARPDGYTLLLVGAVNTINATLYERLNFVFVRDIAPVASMVSAPLVMMVHPSLPVHSGPEFITYAKANPGKISFGSSINGSPLQMAGEMFKIMVIVPYRGTGPMLIDLLSGQLQVTIADLPASVQYIRSGSLRALAVTTAERLPEMGQGHPGSQHQGGVIAAVKHLTAAPRHAADWRGWPYVRLRIPIAAFRAPDGLG